MRLRPANKPRSQNANFYCHHFSRRRGGGRQAGEAVAHLPLGPAPLAPGALDAEDLGHPRPVQVAGQARRGDQVAHVVGAPVATLDGARLAPIQQRRGRGRAGRGVEAARRAFRRRVSRMREDRVLAEDIASARVVADDPSLRAAVEKVAGPLR